MSEHERKGEELERRMGEADKRYEQRFKAQEVAIDKAEAAIEKKLEAMNAFRSVLQEQSSHMLPRSEADVRFRSIESVIELRTGLHGDRLSKIENILSQLAGSTNKGESGKQFNLVVLGLVVNLFISVGAVIVTVLHH
jgi:hypothetical protein